MNALSVQAKPPHPQGKGAGGCRRCTRENVKGLSPLDPSGCRPLGERESGRTYLAEWQTPPGIPGGVSSIVDKSRPTQSREVCKRFPNLSQKAGKPAKSDNFRKRFQLQPLTASTQTVYSAENLGCEAI